MSTNLNKTPKPLALTRRKGIVKCSETLIHFKRVFHSKARDEDGSCWIISRSDMFIVDTHCCQTRISTFVSKHLMYRLSMQCLKLVHDNTSSSVDWPGGVYVSCSAINVLDLLVRFGKDDHLRYYGHKIDGSSYCRFHSICRLECSLTM